MNTENLKEMEKWNTYKQMKESARKVAKTPKQYELIIRFICEWLGV
jgi:hypothetical protein